MTDGWDLNEKLTLSGVVDALDAAVELTFLSGRVPASLLPLFQAAWREIKNQHDFTLLRLAIDNAYPHSLAAHGLTGAQLDMKLSTLSELYRAAAEKRSARNLRRLLSALRSVFGSVLDALGIGDFLSEFLDMLTGAIQESAEDLASS